MNIFRAPAMLLKTPMDLWMAIRELPLVETVEALAQLPMALQQSMEKANELIEAAGGQLASLEKNADVMISQLETMIEAAQALGEVTPRIIEMVDIAKQQMELTTVQLEVTNDQLAKVIAMGEPLDKVGQRIQKFLDKRG